MVRCCSLKTSHPHLLPQSPKVCSVHLCLFFCFAFRVIIKLCFSEWEDFIHISVYLFTWLVEKFRRWESVCLFLFLLLSSHLEIIPVNKGTSLEDSLTFQREGRRAEGDGQGEQDQSQVNLKPTTMTQKPQATHCLLYTQPPTLVLPTFPYESQNPICTSVWIKWLPPSIPKCGFTRDLSKACSQHQEEA